MIFQWAQASGKDHKQILGKQVSNQSQQNNLWPFSSTPINTPINKIIPGFAKKEKQCRIR